MVYDARREDNTASPQQLKWFLLRNLQALMMSRNVCAGQIHAPAIQLFHGYAKYNSRRPNLVHFIGATRHGAEYAIHNRTEYPQGLGHPDWRLVGDIPGPLSSYKAFIRGVSSCAQSTPKMRRSKSQYTYSFSDGEVPLDSSHIGTCAVILAPFTHMEWSRHFHCGSQVSWAL